MRSKDEIIAKLAVANDFENINHITAKEILSVLAELERRIRAQSMGLSILQAKIDMDRTSQYNIIAEKANFIVKAYLEYLNN